MAVDLGCGSEPETRGRCPPREIDTTAPGLAPARVGRYRTPEIFRSVIEYAEVSLPSLKGRQLFLPVVWEPQERLSTSGTTTPTPARGSFPSPTPTCALSGSIQSAPAARRGATSPATSGSPLNGSVRTV